MSEVFCDVLEKLAFMFGEPTPKEDLPETAAKYIDVGMTFSGPMEGALALAVPEEMCKEIAANVLGMELEDELVRNQAIDALKEVLNVTCGHVLTSIAGDEPVFDLSVPVAREIEAVAWEEFLGDSETLAFIVDDCPAALRFSMEEKGT